MSHIIDMPYFSIIVPVYKTEQYLADCLKSVMDQTFSDFECIVINDGSPDFDKPNNQIETIFNTITKSDQRFRLIQKPNEGQGPTKNLGLKESKGQRLVVLDSDDFLELDFLEIAHKATQSLKPNQIAYSQIKVFDGEKYFKFEEKQRFTPSVNNLANTLVFPTWTITGINYFWSIEDIKESKINYQHKNKAEDTIFVVDNLIEAMLKHSDLELIKTSAYYIYRSNPNQITSSEGYDAELFKVSTSLMQHRLGKLAKIGLKYLVLGRLFVLRFSTYRQRILTKNKIKRLVLNILAKFLTILAILIAGTRKS